MKSRVRAVARVVFVFALSGVAGSPRILDLSARNREGGAETEALRGCFDALGIPFALETDPVAATGGVSGAGDAMAATGGVSGAGGVRPPVVYVAGSLANGTLTKAEKEALYAYVEGGGTVVAAGTLGSDYLPLFGIKAPVDSKTRFFLSFAPRETDPALAYVDRAEERRVRFGNPNMYDEIFWTHSFSARDATALASTGDGLSALAVNEYGDGRAYYFGSSFSDLLLIPRLNYDFEAQRSWANTFEPGSDAFALILKAIYEETGRPCAFLSNVPYGGETALLLSHDVDTGASFANSVPFAALEKKYGVRATYFITTKYFEDSQDVGYYSAENIAYLRKVRELGGDIGSHSVSHSSGFAEFPLGVEAVTRANYDVSKPTLFGEVKVSRESLSRDFPGAPVACFRSGELRFPARLVFVEEKAGYTVDSSYAAQDILCNFAYFAYRERNTDSPRSAVVEIPVTFDDSQGYLRADNVDELVAAWLDVIGANADNGAISTLLIHPTVAGYKLEAEAKLLEAMKGRDAWIGDLASYGAFYARRSRVGLVAETKDGRAIARLSGGDWPRDLAVVIKAAQAGKGVAVVDRDSLKEYKVTVRTRGDWLVVTRGD